MSENSLKQDLIVRIEAYAEAKKCESLFLHKLAAESLAGLLDELDIQPIVHTGELEIPGEPVQCEVA